MSNLIKAASVLAVPFALVFSLQHPSKITKEGILIGGACWWIGRELANSTQKYFQKKIEAFNNTSNKENEKYKNNLTSLWISLGVGATFILLNNSRISQIFERFAPRYSDLVIRAIGFGYMSRHTAAVLTEAFHGS